ncbi:MAG: phosphatase PAP2 family protein [Gammaproteobacteria bacterium]|jgi:undecaprenyl-diphosphatase
MQKDRLKSWFCSLLRCVDYPCDRSQLLLAGVMLILGFLFLLLFVNVILHGPLTYLNSDVHSFFRVLRTSALDKIAVVIVSFGYYKMLTLVVFALICWLVLRRYWLAAIHWFVGWVCALGSVFVFRLIYFSPRPSGLLHVPTTSSFPSGHVTGSIVFYVLFAFMFTKDLPLRARKYIYWVVAILCIAIALSRLYLGVHWLTDVIAGVCLGGVIVLFTIISYRRYQPVKIAVTGVFVVTLVALIISNAWFLHKNYFKHLNDYQMTNIGVGNNGVRS